MMVGFSFQNQSNRLHVLAPIGLTTARGLVARHLIFFFWAKTTTLSYTRITNENCEIDNVPAPNGPALSILGSRYFHHFFVHLSFDFILANYVWMINLDDKLLRLVLFIFYFSFSWFFFLFLFCCCFFLLWNTLCCLSLSKRTLWIFYLRAQISINMRCAAWIGFEVVILQKLTPPLRLSFIYVESLLQFGFKRKWNLDTFWWIFHICLEIKVSLFKRRH